MAELPNSQFSTTTRLNAEGDLGRSYRPFGDRVGGDDNAINTYAAYHAVFNLKPVLLVKTC